MRERQIPVDVVEMKGWCTVKLMTTSVPMACLFFVPALYQSITLPEILSTLGSKFFLRLTVVRRFTSNLELFSHYQAKTKCVLNCESDW